MSESTTSRLRAHFEAVISQPRWQWDRVARELCGDDRVLLGRLLRLLDRDRNPNLECDVEQWGDALEGTLRQVLPDGFEEGRRIGPFRIESAIGSGGMGRVYQAVREDGEVVQRVAIKLIRGEAMNPALLRRFSNERRLLAALDHPGICRFIDAGSLPDGTPYVVMERLYGEPLLAYCDRHRCSLPERIDLFRKVLAAVEHAHRSLVVHRDIKSSNVLVGPDGEPKLLDFGIAKTLASDTDEGTVTAERFLTPRNCAPEQILGGPIGVACDVYALGTLLYELLCGLPPFDFDGMSAGQIEHAVLHLPPRPPSARIASASVDPGMLAASRGVSSSVLSRHLRGDLDTIVLNCLRKSPNDRYGSVEQLDAELRRLRQGLPIAARRDERWYRVGRFLRRHRSATALSTLLALTTLVSLVAISGQAISLSQERNRALFERDRAQHAIDILRDAFMAADPARSTGADVSAGQILAAAQARLETSLVDRPDLFVEVAAMIAEVQLALGQDTQAGSLARNGLRVAHSTPGIEPEAALRLALLTAHADIGMGDTASAESAWRSAERSGASERPEWQVLRGRLLNAQGQSERAIDILRQAVVATAEQPPDSELATAARRELAQAMRWLERYDEALATVDEMLAWQNRTLPPDHPRILITRLWRADLLRASDRLDQAHRELDTLLDRIERSYGPLSTLTAQARASLARVEFAQGRIDAAIANQTAATEAWRISVGATHADTIRARFNLALMMSRDNSRVEQTESVFRAAIAAADDRYGMRSDTATLFRLRLANHLERAGRVGLAIEAALQAAEAADHQALSAATRERLKRTLLGLSRNGHCAGSDRVGPSGSAIDACDRLSRAVDPLSLDAIDP